MLKEVCAFISEYYHMFPRAKIEDNASFLIIGLEGSDDLRASSWEGKLGALKTTLKQQMRKIKTKVIKMHEQLHYDEEKNIRVV